MRSRSKLPSVLAAAGLVVAACAGGGATPTAQSTGAASPAPGTTAPASPTETVSVSLQLQWTPQAQFAGYFAADYEGFYAEEGLDVEMVDGGPDVLPHVVGSDPNGPDFTISWVPKVLELRDKGQSDLVNIAQVFQRSGTLSVAWADSGIDSPEDFAGKKVGVWDFGNEYEVTAAAKKVGLEAGTDYEKVIQPFNMDLLLNREIDVAEAMIYNEYAQVLETQNPDTGALYQPTDLTVINYNDVGTAMLQDAIFVRDAWLQEEGNEDVAERFLRASFRGWIFCREDPDACVQYSVDAGSLLPGGHQRWMMNEILPLVWPAPDGIGAMPVSTWDQTVQISIDAGIITKEPDEGAYRTDLAEAARQGIQEDAIGADFQKGTVEVTPGGN